MTLLESIRKFEPPLDSGLVHLEESDTHDHDDNTGDSRENSFPDLFRLGPQINQFGVELSSAVIRFGMYTYDLQLQ